MTREQRLSIIIGFCLILITAILVADYFSPASNDRMIALNPELDGTVVTTSGEIPAGSHDKLDAAGDSLSAHGSDSRIFLDGSLTKGTEAVVTGDPEPGAQNDLTMGADLGGEKTPPVGDSKVSPAAPEQTYILRQGETLYAVARKHYGNGSFSSQLAEYNRDALPANLIPKAGTKLRIPDKSVLLALAGRKAEPVVTNPPAKAGQDAGPAEGNSKKPDPKAVASKPYVVKGGDTLDKISSRLLGTSKRWKEILDLNPGLDPKKLKVGQTIKVPAK